MGWATNTIGQQQAHEIVFRPCKLDGQDALKFEIIERSLGSPDTERIQIHLCPPLLACFVLDFLLLRSRERKRKRKRQGNRSVGSCLQQFLLWRNTSWCFLAINPWGKQASSLASCTINSTPPIR